MDGDLGKIYLAPFDVLRSDEEIVQPNILFVSKAREEIITEENIEAPPDLIIEILSEPFVVASFEIPLKEIFEG